ncbi:hypothetical protein SK128_025711 [Halocaridina rubra]|uniref:Methuselah N-terminal domain-containing protein n=1 Tax=Halocaridina rubra TaxID=373956 RepID=A0AAN8XJJ8_HALRR
MAIRWILLLLCLQHFSMFVKSKENGTKDDDDCKGFTCIRKCCPDDQILNFTNCVVPLDKSHLWTPTFYNGTFPTFMAKPPNLQYLYGRMNCESFLLLPHSSANDSFYLQTNGTLYVPLYNIYYDPHIYCIDKLYVSKYCPEEIALLCFEEDPSPNAGLSCQIVKNYVYPVLLLVMILIMA